MVAPVAQSCRPLAHKPPEITTPCPGGHNSYIFNEGQVGGVVGGLGLELLFSHCVLLTTMAESAGNIAVDFSLING